MPEDNTQSETTSKRGAYRKHQERTKNRPGFVLQDRDIQILRAIWENRFLNRNLIVRLFPPDPERTPAHLRKEHPKNIGTNLDRRLSLMFHNGLVDRLRTIRGGELIYALAERGADLLADRQLPLPLVDWQEKNRDLSNSYIDHTLMVANFRVSLTEAIRQAPDISLTLFERESAKLRAYWQHAGERAFVLPDAFLILSDHTRSGGAQQAFFLEADRSTMKHSRLEQKFLFYSWLYLDRQHEQAFSITDFKVLTICKSAERASNLLDLVADPDSPIPAATKHLFFFTSETAYAEHPTNTLAAIWRAGDDPDQLRAIVGSPLARK